MTFKKCIGHLLVVLLLLTQLSFAQHETVHFREGSHTPAHQQEKNNPAQDKFCHLCQLSHDYAKTLTPSVQEFLPPFLSVVDISVSAESLNLQSRPSPYAARAPPPAFSA